MNRKQIEQQYTVVDGEIRSPGKFEFEPIYAPYFWDLVMNGDGDRRYFGENDSEDSDCGDENESSAELFLVDSTDREEFPELEDISEVWLIEDSQGFVIAKYSESDVSRYFGVD